MPLYYKWDIRNSFSFLLQFFSLIFGGLGGVYYDENFDLLQIFQPAQLDNIVATLYCDCLKGCIDVVRQYDGRKPNSLGLKSGTYPTTVIGDLWFVLSGRKLIVVMTQKFD